MLRPPTCYFHRSDQHACTRKRQAKRPCLGTEEAAEDDGCSSSARKDNIGDEAALIRRMTVTATAAVAARM